MFDLSLWVIKGHNIKFYQQKPDFNPLLTKISNQNVRFIGTLNNVWNIYVKSVGKHPRLRRHNAVETSLSCIDFHKLSNFKVPTARDLSDKFNRWILY